MLTQDERRAVVFLAAVAAVGAAIRAVRPAADAGTGALREAEVAPALAAQDPARQAARSLEAERRSKPLEAGELVDVDRATAVELDRLPRIGPALAQRIVTDRERHGPFGSLAALGRVPGVGPRLLEALEPLVTFTGTPVASEGQDSAVGRGGTRIRSGSSARREDCVGAGSAPVGRGGTRAACPDVVVVNRATAAELECLPGIGPALAARILAVRKVHGPFLFLAQLAAVPGLGPRRVARLAGRLRVP